MSIEPPTAEYMSGLIPVGRLGRAEEVAGIAAYLCSTQAAYITGETIGVSGGMGLGG